VKQPASRDVSGSTLERYRRLTERALFVDTEAQNVTVAPGDRAVLNCRVQQLGAKTVRRISVAELLTFLQRVSIASYAKRCISYDRFCLTVCLTV